MRKVYTMRSLLLLFLLLAVLLSACGKQEPAAPGAVSSPTTEISDTGREQETTGDTTESSAALPAESGTTNGILEISFDFARGTTPASSQFAVWIEDSSGNLVKTLYVTNFTANGGYAKRKESIPTWVSKAKPSVLPEAELDAISGATPQAGLGEESFTDIAPEHSAKFAERFKHPEKFARLAGEIIAIKQPLPEEKTPQKSYGGPEL